MPEKFQVQATTIRERIKLLLHVNIWFVHGNIIAAINFKHLLETQILVFGWWTISTCTR